MKPQWVLLGLSKGREVSPEKPVSELTDCARGVKVSGATLLTIINVVTPINARITVQKGHSLLTGVIPTVFQKHHGMKKAMGAKILGMSGSDGTGGVAGSAEITISPVIQKFSLCWSLLDFLRGKRFLGLEPRLDLFIIIEKIPHIYHEISNDRQMG